LFGLFEHTGRWGPFASWLEHEHPDDVGAMFAKDESGNGNVWPTFTDAALPLWNRYVDEWVASQN
jgi:hypothetical protein